MKISSIAITNMRGFRGEVKFNFPAVGIIRGQHGVGKSSLEQSLMYTLGRRPLAAKGARGVQHDPEMLNIGSESGSTIIAFDEDVDFLRVSVKPDATSRQVKTKGARKWEDAGGLIDDITNALAYNPMAFLDLTAKERLEAFLKVVPVEISQDEVKTAVGEIIPVFGKPSLEMLNAAFDDIFALRTKTNSDADSLTKHAKELEAALPDEPESGDWTAALKQAQDDISTLKASEAEEIKRIGTEFKRLEAEATRIRREVDAEVDADINKRIAELEAERAAKKAAIEVDERQHVETARATANIEAKEIRDTNAPLLAGASQRLGEAQERLSVVARTQGARESMEKARESAAAHKARSGEMTAALDRLTALKASVGSRMSIKGFTIAAPRPGMPVDICREEKGALVPFSIWNEADKDRFCLKMAVLYRGACGIVCVDEIGHWSKLRRTEMLAACRYYAKENNMQFLLGMSTSTGDLEVVDVTEADPEWKD